MGEIGEAWRRQCITCGELALAACLRELVPRAYRQAIIAAEDAIADCGAEFTRDRTFVLDGEIGDATARIEPVGRGKRGGRADIETRAATTAMIDLGRVRRQLDRREDRAEEQPRAELARHQIGV